MSGEALTFQRLRVGRMPGFEAGGFDVENLSAAVNVVFGPNASGKTTLARAIQCLLWPRLAPPRAVLIGQFRLDGADWRVSVDGGHVAWQRNGADSTSGPTLPPAETRDRYSLPLHELLTATNRDLAQQVLRESAGGYDIAAAAEPLGFRPAVTRSGREREVRDAKAQLDELRGHQQDLCGRESHLADLAARLEQARSAAGRVRLIESALAALETQRDLEEAQGELAGFPGAMERLSGQEAETLDQLRDDAASLADQQRQARRDLKQAQDDQAACALGEAGLAQRELVAMRAELETLGQLDAVIAAKRRELEGWQARRREELAGLGGSADPDRLARLDVSGVDELARFADEIDRLRARQQACEATRRWLAGSDPPANLPALQEGELLLSRWLSAPAGPVGLPGWFRAALTLVGALSIVQAALLAALSSGWWLLLAAAGSAAVAVAWWPRGRSDLRALIAQEYARLDLEPPAGWTAAGVEAALTPLRQRLASGQADADRARRRAELDEDQRQVESQLSQFEQRRATLVERLGVAPSCRETQLAWLLAGVRRFQEAAREADGLRAELEQAERQRAESLDRIAVGLAPYGYAPPADAAAASGMVEELADRSNRHRSAAERSRAAAGRLDELTASLETADRRRRELFERLGLAVGDEAGLADLLRRRAAWLAARDRLNIARARHEQAGRDLDRLEPFDPSIRSMSGPQLAAALDEARDRAGKAEPLIREIAETETKIAQAKRSHDVETALADYQQALAALAEQRDADGAAVVGAVLAEHLQRDSQDRERPEVFHRARGLLSRITQGRYRLEFLPGDPPAFRATDTVRGVGHALDELSSGTRVQLLLAVRIAFVEQQELGARLPLILDETLANSDDLRADAIMRAVLALARTGRQVFYFTAQRDELAKWKSLLESDDRPADWRLIDLAEARGLAEAQRAGQVEPMGLDLPAPPSPAGRTHDDYGRLLNAPPFDPRQPIEAVHLWHLVEDVGLLHRLLQRGLERWGALKELHERAGPGGLGVEPADYRRIAAAADVLGTLGECWRVGRARRVDRAALIESGAVSDAFIDAVSELADSLGGDGRRLLAALEAGQVPRFRRSACDALRQHLDQGDYLPADEPLSVGQIRVRLSAVAAPHLAVGELSDEQVARLAGKIGRPA